MSVRNVPRQAADFARCVPALLFLLVALASPLMYGEPCRAMGIFEVYDQLLPLRGATGGGVIQSVTVRYVPGDTSSESEMKVLLTEERDGRASLHVWRPSPVSIQQQLRNLRSARGEECDTALISSIRVDRYDGTARMASTLYRDFKSVRVPVAMESDFYFDTARFEVLVETPMNTSTFVLYGPGMSERRPHPLIKWAAAVVRAGEQQRSVEESKPSRSMAKD